MAMAKQYLIINIGSQSKKCALYGESGELLRSVHLEDEHYRDDTSELFAGENLIIGIRVVAPGQYFTTHRLIDDEYVSKLEEASRLTPLHIAPVLAEIKLIRERYPQYSLYALSDSALMSERPLTDKLYGLPRAEAEQWGLYRWGYHGFSMASVLAQVPELSQKRLIICHLGGGVSVAAVAAGEVLSTSMGYSPLEGPTMSSRVGNIDPSAVLALLTLKQFSAAELADYFNHQGGLLGISGRSASVRELLALEASGDEGAKLALDTFVWQIRRHIGAALALLGGVDALIFTATIGERSVPIRQRILADWEGLGLMVDQAKNQQVTSVEAGSPAWLQVSGSPALIGVVAAAEEAQMLEALRTLV
jgi:acetate kinase